MSKPENVPPVWEMNIRAVTAAGKTRVEVRQTGLHSGYGPAPEPIVLDGVLSKREVLSYLVICEAMGVPPTGAVNEKT